MSPPSCIRQTKRSALPRTCSSAARCVSDSGRGKLPGHFARHPNATKELAPMIRRVYTSAARRRRYLAARRGLHGIGLRERFGHAHGKRPPVLRRPHCRPGCCSHYLKKLARGVCESRIKAASRLANDVPKRRGSCEPSAAASPEGEPPAAAPGVDGEFTRSTPGASPGRRNSSTPPAPCALPPSPRAKQTPCDPLAASRPAAQACSRWASPCSCGA